MFELSFRLVAAGLVVLLAGWLDIPDFDVAWKAALAVFAYSGFGYALERKDIKNAGVAGFFAVTDSATIAVLLASAGLLDRLGFLVLAPCAYAAAKHGSLPSAMAPIASGSLFLAHSLFSSKDPSGYLYAQAVGVLLVGLLLNHRRIVVTVTRDVVGEIEPMAGPEPDAFLSLRENFRKMRDMYRDLERKSRRDRLSVQIYETRFANGERFYQRLSTKIQELTGAEGITLYTMAQFEDSMVVRAVTGEVPDSIADSSFKVDTGKPNGQIKHSLQLSLSALLPEARRSVVTNVVLSDRGKVIGFIALTHGTPDKLDEIKDVAEEIAPLVSAMIVEQQESEQRDRRLKETELLYETAVVTEGSDTPNTIAARVIRELSEILPVDHLGVFWLDGEEALSASTHGSKLNIVDSMSFANGPGIGGWLRTGSPELIIFKTLEDDRCPSEEVLKKRVGSYCLIPIQFSNKPYGFLTAATHRAGGVDGPEVETMRIVAAELGRGISRLMGLIERAEGLTTPVEFQRIVRDSGRGCMVYLEPLKREQLLAVYGKPAIDHALRQFSRRVRAKLPAGSVVCRRAEGDFVVFLRDSDERFASSWANDMAATASMIGITTPDGSSKIPLAIRTKVAVIGQESDVVSSATIR